MNDFVMVYVTVKSKAEAEKIARTLLVERLIACANILGPVSSHFQWEEKIDSSEEYLMIIKTRANLFMPLKKRVMKLHSYEVPEILAVPIVNGSAGYFNWMNSVLPP